MDIVWSLAQRKFGRNFSNNSIRLLVSYCLPRHAGSSQRRERFWTDQDSLYVFNSHKSSLVSKLYLSVLIPNDMKNINFLRSWFSFVVITFVSLRAKSPLETAPSEAFEAGSFPTFLVLTPSILD